MREILIKYYSNTPISVSEGLLIIEEYMKEIDKFNQQIIDYIINPMNPFAQGMLEKAINASANYLQVKYNLCKLYSKEGVLLMVF